MLKKLLKMNLAVLLAGSSASVISTNNIVFAEENPQDENVPNTETNGFIDEISEEESVVNADSVARTPLQSFKGLEEVLPASSDGGFVLDFVFDETKLEKEKGKIEYIEFKLYNKETKDLLMERNIVAGPNLGGKVRRYVDVFQAPNVDDPIELYATVRLIAYKDAGFSDSEPYEYVFQNPSYKSNLKKPYFEPKIEQIGIDKEKRCFKFKLGEAEQSSVLFKNYQVSIVRIPKDGRYPYDEAGSEDISTSLTDKEFYVGDYDGNDFAKGLIRTTLSEGFSYYIRVLDGDKVAFNNISAGWGKLGYYEGQMDKPDGIDTGNSADISSCYNEKSKAIELTLDNLTDGYKYAVSKSKNEAEDSLNWKTAVDSSVTFTGLESGENYYVYSKAVDIVGSKFDSEVSVSNGTYTVAKIPPSVYGLSTTSTSGTEIILEWNGLKNNDEGTAESIEIERDGQKVGQIDKDKSGSFATTYADTGLTPGSTYKYTVKVIYNKGVYGPAEEVVASTIAKPTINKFELDDNDVKNNKLKFTWDVASNDIESAKVKLEVKKDDNNDTYHELVPVDNQTDSYTFDGTTYNGGDYLVKDLVFRLTAEGRGGSVEKERNYIIKGNDFNQKQIKMSTLSFTYNGNDIILDPTIENVPTDWYDFHYYKIIDGQYMETNLPIVNAGMYEVKAVLTETGKKYYTDKETQQLFAVAKADQPATKTSIENHPDTTITAGERLEYKLIQDEEIKEGAEVNYDVTGDSISVDGDGIITLLEPGTYKIDTKIAETENYKEKKLSEITGTIKAGKLDLVNTSFTTKVNTKFDFTKNILFKTAAENEITKDALGDNYNVTYTVNANDLGVQEGKTTFIKPTTAGKLEVTVEVTPKESGKALYLPLAKNVVIDVEAVSNGGGSYSSSSFTGWKSNGSYYEKGKPVSGIKEIKGVTYLFDKKGFPMKNQMIEIKEKTYITDGEGKIRKGKTEFEGATYVMDKTEGHMLRDWALVDGEWYFMSYETGKVHMNLWASSASGDWYFMDAEGHMKKNQWIASSEGRWYYVGADGKMVSNSSVDGCWINEQGIYLSPTYKG